MTAAKILIVEDEMLVAANLEACLEDRGYQPVGIAPDLISALKLAEKRPDVALVDVNLRDGVTGPLVAEKLRAQGISVIFITANPRMINPKTTTALGILDKPYEDNVVAAAIDYALDQKHGACLLSPPAGLMLLSA